MPFELNHAVIWHWNLSLQARLFLYVCSLSLTPDIGLFKASKYSDCFVHKYFFPFCRMEILPNPTRGLLYLIVLCRQHDFQRTECPLPAVSFVFSPALAFVWLLRLWFEVEKFHRLQTGTALCISFSACTKTPNFSTCPFFLTTTPALIPTNFPYNYSSSVIPSWKFKSSCPTEFQKRGPDIAASTSSLLALLIFCSARSTD